LETCVQIDCQTNAGYLVSVFFKDTPDSEEETVGNMECSTRKKKKLPIAQIQI